MVVRCFVLELRLFCHSTNQRSCYVTIATRVKRNIFLKTRAIPYILVYNMSGSAFGKMLKFDVKNFDWRSCTLSPLPLNGCVIGQNHEVLSIGRFVIIMSSCQSIGGDYFQTVHHCTSVMHFNRIQSLVNSFTSSVFVLEIFVTEPSSKTVF